MVLVLFFQKKSVSIDLRQHMGIGKLLLALCLGNSYWGDNSLMVQGM